MKRCGRWNHLPSAANVSGCRIITPAKSWRRRPSMSSSLSWATRIARSCATGGGGPGVTSGLAGSSGSRGLTTEYKSSGSRAGSARCLLESLRTSSALRPEAYTRDAGRASVRGACLGAEQLSISADRLQRAYGPVPRRSKSLGAHVIALQERRGATHLHGR
jgi:hypothetical protein